MDIGVFQMKYHVKFKRTTYFDVIIEANSQAEADQRANEMSPAQICDAEFDDQSRFEITSISPATKVSS